MALVDTQTSGAMSYKYLLVLDFEATCEENNREFQNEIIEFPTVVVDVEQQAVVEVFHSYVRPVINPALTPFCTSLTGITQDIVESAPTFDQVYPEWQQFASKYADNGLLVTCGDWDLKTMLPSQLKLSNVTSLEFPFVGTWSNIKFVATKHFGHNVRGMAGMLAAMNLKLEGRHHSGIDDCKNIARCAIWFLQAGTNIGATIINFKRVKLR